MRHPVTLAPRRVATLLHQAAVRATTTQAADGGQFQVKLKVRQEGVPDSFQMFVPVTLDTGKGQVLRYRVKVMGQVSEITLPPVSATPKSVKFNDLEGVLAEVKHERWGS